MSRIFWNIKKIKLKRVSFLKVIIIFLIIIVFFLFSNYRYFLWIYYNEKWNSLYYDGNYTWALENHNKAFSYLENASSLYNIWNDFFKYWESLDNVEEKKQAFNSSLQAYSGSLNIEENKETKENYDIVLERLKALEEKENKKEDNTQGNNNSWEQDKKWDEDNKQKNNESWEDNIQENNQTGEKQENNNWETDENSKDTWDKSNEKSENSNLSEQEEENNFMGLSDKQLNSIEDYLESLKQEEINNQKYFNKQNEDSNNPNDFFKQFFQNDSFFDDFIDRWWEKDW